MTDSNMKLVKIPTLDYQYSVIVQMALDALAREYQKNLDNCIELKMDSDRTDYWRNQLERIAAAYRQVANGHVDLVEIEVAQ